VLSSCSDEKEVAQVSYKKSVPSLPSTLDPAEMNDTSSLLISEMIYDGLLRFDGAKIVSAIAKDWKFSRDNLSITFFIRDGVTFHNGQVVTSDDVISSLSRYVAHNSKVFNHFDSILAAKEYRRKIAKKVQGLVKIDSSTIQIKLNKPDPKILMSLAGATAKIFPKKELEKKDFFKNPIGSGAYKVKDISEKKISLVRFDKYYSDLPRHKDFELIEHDTFEKIEKSLTNKDIIDYSGQIFTGNEQFDSRFIKKTMTSPETWIIGLNSSIPPFNSMKFRRVFKSLFDSNAFRRKFHKNSIEAKSYVPPHLLQPILDSEKIDTNKSVSEHDEFDLFIPKELAQSAEIAQYLQLKLREVGFKVKVNTLKWHELMKHYDKRSASVLLYSMNVDYPDAYFMFQGFLIGDKDNFFAANNKNLHNLITSSKNLKDSNKKMRVYQKISKIIEDEAFTVNLLHPRHTYYVHKCIKGFKASFMGVVHGLLV